jgi:RNA recognition motif-containing protein
LKKMLVNNLPSDASEDSITQLFSQFGTVRSVYVASDVFTGKCRGFGSVEMEGHEARAAVAALNGKMYEGKPLRVRFDDGRGKGKRRR